MSKKKKKSLENLLEESLVPKEDWPYELPPNWVWVKLNSSLINLQYGYTESSSIEKVGPHYLRITDIQNNKVNWNEVPYCKISEKDYEKYRLYPNDLVVARTGATTGKSYLISNPPDSVFASYLIRLTTEKNLLPKYLWEYMKSPVYWNQITVVKKGSAQPGANAKILGGLKLPLAPMEEQKRIAKKVEELLEKVEKSKELIDRVKDTFEPRRSTILDKAFRGELTQNWRKVNKEIIPATELIDMVTKELKKETKKKIKKVSSEEIPHEIPKTWSWVRASEVCDVRDGTHDSPKYIEEGYPLITSKNLKSGGLDFSKVNFISEEDHNNIGKRSKVEQGDILFAMIGTIGNPVLIREIDNEFSIKNVGLFKPYKSIDSEYLVYYLESLNYLQPLIKNAKGSTQKFISLGKLRDSLIPVPPLEEQIVIKSKLKSILDRTNNMHRFLKKVDIDAIKMAILSKAYRGDLGTNDPFEESSLELLKEVLKDK
ncbi:restriction endonuclease subunit S [Virgibacillus halodenitrificans]|uniref:restriction endonuclease subunit S n=1 Tax=Virgibacillus halodenitrificans TaxID=1482 RepID=UPI002DBB2E40|nr:restriction endonuclease subunit S [Virgibacillus halodenitrificans]MEC2158016.1 restriction endonuclease subunit S [Virgibacillus halodenitrificans]